MVSVDPAISLEVVANVDVVVGAVVVAVDDVVVVVGAVVVVVLSVSQSVSSSVYRKM
jgi:hypothetical protein